MHPKFPNFNFVGPKKWWQEEESNDQSKEFCQNGTGCFYKTTAKGCKFRHPSLEKQKQKKQQKQKQKKKKNQRTCRFGLKCNSLIFVGNQCHNDHEYDASIAGTCYQIEKNNLTIVIYKGNKVRCLLNYQVPVELENKTYLEPGQYYLAEFVNYAKSNTAIKLNVFQPLGSFGQIHKQIDILKKYYDGLTVYDSIKPGDQLLTGVVETDRYGTYMLKSQKGKDFNLYFKQGKANGKFFLREGCTITYSGTPDQYKVHSIQYKPFYFSGILQFDTFGYFYVQCRNAQHKQIRVVNIPKILQKQMKQIKQYIPYTFMLRGFQVEPDQVNKVNKFLAKILVKGKFIDRPPQSLFSIGVLEQEIDQIRQESINEAIYYQYNIDDAYSKKLTLQKKAKTVKRIEELQKFQEQFIFTLDTQNSRLLQDAICVKCIQKGDKQCYKIGVHATDVDAYMPENSQSDQLTKVQGMLTYIKGRRFDNIDILRNKFSLSKGQHLVQSMLMELDQDSLIDFASIKFCSSLINIRENYIHPEMSKKISQLRDLFKLQEKLENIKYLDHMYLSSHALRNIKYPFEKILTLSYQIPTFMWEVNAKKITDVKKAIDEHLIQLIQKMKQFIKQSQQLIFSHQTTNKLNTNVKQMSSTSTVQSPDINKSPLIEQSMELLTIQDKKSILKIGENSVQTDLINLINEVMNNSSYMLKGNYQIEMHKKKKKQTQLQRKININKAKMAFKVLMKEVFSINKIEIQWKNLKQVSQKFNMAINKQKDQLKKREIIQYQRRTYFYFPYIIQQVTKEQKKAIMEQVYKQNEDPIQNKPSFWKGVADTDKYENEVFSIFSHETQQLLNFIDFDQDDLKELNTKQKMQYKKQFIQGVKYGMKEKYFPKLILLQIQQFVDQKIGQVMSYIQQNSNQKKYEEILSLGMKHYNKQVIQLSLDQMQNKYTQAIYYKKLTQIAKRYSEREILNNRQIEQKNTQAQVNSEINSLLYIQKSSDIMEQKDDAIDNSPNQQKLQRLITKNKHIISFLFSFEKVLSQKYSKDQTMQIIQSEKQKNITTYVYYQIISKICRIVRQFLKMADSPILQMKGDQFMQQLQQIGFTKDIINEDRVQINQKFEKFCYQNNKSTKMFLKWNNPVRSYASLVRLRLLKYYPWVFQGELSVKDVLLNYQDIFVVNQKFQELEDIVEKEEKKKKYQLQISKQVFKNQLFYKIKDSPFPFKSIFNRTTRPDEKGYSKKYVYHNVFEEVKIKNSYQNKHIKDRMSGTIVIASQFPQVVECVLSN